LGSSRLWPEGTSLARLDHRDDPINRSRAGCMSSGLSSLMGLAYLVIGLIVASAHAYFVHLTTVMPILSAILAVLLWPLVLLGVNLHLH
jgi:hypothetical protein